MKSNLLKTIILLSVLVIIALVIQHFTKIEKSDMGIIEIKHNYVPTPVDSSPRRWLSSSNSKMKRPLLECLSANINSPLEAKNICESSRHLFEENQNESAALVRDLIIEILKSDLPKSEERYYIVIEAYLDWYLEMEKDPYRKIELLIYLLTNYSGPARTYTLNQTQEEIDQAIKNHPLHDLAVIAYRHLSNLMPSDKLKEITPEIISKQDDQYVKENIESKLEEVLGK